MLTISRIASCCPTMRLHRFVSSSSASRPVLLGSSGTFVRPIFLPSPLLARRMGELRGPGSTIGSAGGRSLLFGSRYLTGFQRFGRELESGVVTRVKPIFQGGALAPLGLRNCEQLLVH